MTGEQIAVLSLLEAVALVFVVRLWVRPRGMGVWGRVIWSVVLLVPLFGVLIYGFVRTSPKEHPYESEEADEATTSSRSGGDGGGHD